MQRNNNTTRKLRTGGAIATSDYVGDKLVLNASATAEIIPPGAVSLHINNDSANDIRIIFTQTEVESQALVLGEGIKIKAGTERDYMVPFDAEYWGYIAFVADVTVGTVWG